MLDLKIKVCGLNSSIAVEAAVDAGADYIGCVFDINSIQHITPLLARDICISVPEYIKKVAVVADTSDYHLDEIITYFKPDVIQLNGTETTEYLQLLRNKFDKEIAKTITLNSIKDLEEIDNYIELVDILLFQPTNHYLYSHGNKKNFFDWQALSKLKINIPWMISGNISKHNLARIIRASKAKEINVDQSLNSSLGIKDPVLIKEFIKAFREFCRYEPN